MAAQRGGERLLVGDIRADPPSHQPPVRSSPDCAQLP
jgi:hypothetical protein